MKAFFSQKQLNLIADALVSKGYIVLETDTDLGHLLAEHIVGIESFKPASIGRNASKHENPIIRSDKTLWLESSGEMDRLYLDAMRELQMGMNSRLYMGLKRFEAHYSYYSVGNFYKKHLDAFSGKAGRKLTLVFYLNKEWDLLDGGALLLYDQEEVLLERILPTLGRMVIFLSDTFPHEVEISNKERYSIASWFRID